MSNTININVKVTSGVRTPVKVRAYATNVNGKSLGGVGSNKLISDEKIVRFIEKSVTHALQEYFEQLIKEELNNHGKD